MNLSLKLYHLLKIYIRSYKMLSAEVLIGLVFCAASSAKFVFPKEMSTAKTLTDLTNEVLQIVNDNKAMTMNDLSPLIMKQVSAASIHIKKCGSYPSLSDITKAVNELMSKIPKDETIVGDSVSRFQQGLTSHLNRMFPTKSLE